MRVDFNRAKAEADPMTQLRAQFEREVTSSVGTVACWQSRDGCVQIPAALCSREALQLFLKRRD